MPLYLVVGALLFSAFGFALLKSGVGRGLSGWVGVLVFLAVGSGLISFPFGVLMAVWGFYWTMVLWLDSGRYRLPLPPYASSKEVLWFYTFRTICGAIFVFLITPIIILIPLSFNQEPYFSFTPGMLALDPARFQHAGIGISCKTAWSTRGDHRLVVGCLEQCAMGAFDPKFILHRYSGDNPVDCSWDTCGDWPCFKRYAMASSDYGAVDFADDRPIGDYSIWFGLLLCGHQIGQNLLGNYPCACCFGNTVCDHHCYSYAFRV